MRRTALSALTLVTLALTACGTATQPMMAPAAPVQAATRINTHAFIVKSVVLKQGTPDSSFNWGAKGKVVRYLEARNEYNQKIWIFERSNGVAEVLINTQEVTNRDKIYIVADSLSKLTNVDPTTAKAIPGFLTLMKKTFGFTLGA